VAGRSVNVDLRIKAQDEASKALDTVGKALKDLAGAGALAGSGSAGINKFIENITKNVDALGAVSKKAAESLSRLGGDDSRLRSQLAGVTKSIDERTRSVAELAKAEADLQRIQGSFKNISAQKQRTFVGPVPPKLTSLSNTLNAEQSALAKELAAREALIGKLVQNRDAQRQLEEVQRQAERAAIASTDAILKQGAALDALAAAQKRARQAAQQNSVRSRIEQTTGVDRSPDFTNQSRATQAALEKARQTKAAADYEKLFADTLAREAELEARITAENQRQTAERQKQAELARKATQDRINELTGVNRGQSSTNPNLSQKSQEALEKARRAAAERELSNTFAPIAAADEAKRIAEAAKAFNAFEEAARRGAASFNAIKQYARDVAESLDPVARSTRLVAEEQKRLDDAVRNGVLSRQQANAALQRYKANLDGTTDSERRAQRETEALKTYVQELRREFDAEAYAQQFLVRETEKLNKALRQGILTQQEYGKALEVVRRKSEQLGPNANPSLFGLAPYQTQNLLFQLNDIATQLASGTSLSQTLAQQGGQILQLFPRVGNSIITAMRAGGIAIAGVAVVLGGLVAGIGRALENAERLRTFDAILASNADSAQYTAKALNETARAMREFGVTSEDSIKLVRQAISRGLNPDSILEFGKAAKGLAVILGTDVPSAGTELVNVMRGGYQAVIELDEKTNVLTASQRKLIREMVEQGRVTEATNMALRIFTDEFSDTASKAEGPWQSAINELAVSWSNLLDKLGNSAPIKAAVSGLTGLVEVVSGAVDALDGINTIQEKQVRLQEIVTSEFGGLRNRATATPSGYVARAGFENDYRTKRQIEEANRLQREITAEQRKLVAEKLAAEKASTDQANSRVEKANDEVKAAQKRLAIEKKITSEADVRAAVEEKRKELFIQAQQNPRFRGASDQVIGEYVNTQLGTYRLQVEEKLTSYKKQQADEAEREFKARNTATYQAMALLRQTEGRGGKSVATPYWDVNAWRAGFGSDTFTREDGSVGRVTQSTRVTPQMAERDLERRVNELIDVIKKRIGGERFNDFSAKQQGAIVSLYYNYGKNADRIKKDLEPLLQSGTNEQIAAMVRSFANDRPYRKNGKAVNYDRRMAEAAILAQPNLSVEEGAIQYREERDDAQQKFNQSLDAQLDAEERSIANRKALVGLQGEALRAEIERQQIADAIAAREEEVARLNEQRVRDGKAPIEFTQADRERIVVTVRARLKLDEPTKVAADLQKQVDDLQSRKSILQADLTQKQQTGDVGGMRDVQRQIEEIDAKIAQAAQNYLNFLNTPGNADALGLYGVELDNMISKMTQLSQKTAEWKLTIGSATITASEFANAFTNTAVSALDQFAQAIATGKNAFSSLWDAFRQFAADFLLQIARMIQQQIIFNLVSGLLKGLAGGLGGGASAATNSFSGGFSNFNLSGVQFHKGGLVGSGGEFRSVTPSMFANATRYHSGGIAGLKPGEVPSILMKGEEVLTRDDPRHMLNGGGGASGSVKIVNAFDYGDVVSKAMETKAGEKAILNFVRNNSRAVRSAMG